MTRFSLSQHLTAWGLAAVGLFAACVRVEDAFVKAVSPR